MTNLHRDLTIFKLSNCLIFVSSPWYPYPLPVKHECPALWHAMIAQAVAYRHYSAPGTRFGIHALLSYNRMPRTVRTCRAMDADRGEGVKKLEPPTTGPKCHVNLEKSHNLKWSTRLQLLNMEWALSWPNELWLAIQQFSYITSMYVT
ncbi:hypothetical protein EJ05DRAFT_539009 [Pseudovirgaria hyperparasitica]|uniref:Uncharacterized protein n=1 Tax=Pseudovirgaria hyperparasitica TaxID=470096 RepID=A0A6A6W4N7_9PEZI|nr:uncharacterized protein EJ05DRAFT_539009 [Pseudovirgaria hyperparasitica]KAF2756880.1 hypothetical protein EJ05DRAFT_539009 [Pseudovirgaria hyperparasitica]